MEWIEKPAITIRNPGYLGNLLLQFFAAHALATRIGDCTLANFELPEWGLTFPPVKASLFRRTIHVRSPQDFDTPYLATVARSERSVHIVLDHYLQRQSYFLSSEVYRDLLPIVARDVPMIGDDELLINIRTGDILAGHIPFYPLTPIAFYRDLVDRTGLAPVFLGQLEDGLYVRALQAAFPRSRYIPSQGRVRDFDTIRRAAHIVPAVSTFSVAAAWLSNARTIFLQLNGFLNPAHLRECDLLPVDDPRYRFFLFPMYHALPEALALEHHEHLAGTWREISRAQLRVIQTSAPFVKQPDLDRAPHPPPDFDERWYLHTHLAAAISVSEGWYRNGLHHYLDVGRQIGYRVGPEAEDTPYPNVALGQRAWQSSISPWSVGKTSNDDAMRAVNGDRRKEYGFHTDLETAPWWITDLGQEYEIREIHVYNRLGPELLRHRALPLVIRTSANGTDWSEFSRTGPGELFGGETWPSLPLISRPAFGTRARYVKVTAERPNTYLHLAEVEVYAIP